MHKVTTNAVAAVGHITEANSGGVAGRTDVEIGARAAADCRVGEDVRVRAVELVTEVACAHKREVMQTWGSWGVWRSHGL